MKRTSACTWVAQEIGEGDMAENPFLCFQAFEQIALINRGSIGDVIFIATFSLRTD